MSKLVWRGETVNGKYLGEVALLTDLSPVVHCETFVDGNWRLWSYVDDREQVLQQGKTPSLKEAQYICEQTALAIQGIQGLQNASDVPMQPMMPMFMSVMPNMYAQPQQAAYENTQPSMSIQAGSLQAGALQELRFKFRRWAISLTLIGGVFLSIWYSMLLKPVSTISLLLVLTSLIWGAQALMHSFKRRFRHSSASTSPPQVDDGITIFSTSQVRPSRRHLRQQTRQQSTPQPQLAPQFMPAHQLGFTANQMTAHQFATSQHNPYSSMGVMQAGVMQTPMPHHNLPATQALVQVVPQVHSQLQAPQIIQQAQTGFYNPALQMQHLQQFDRGNG